MLKVRNILKSNIKINNILLKKLSIKHLSDIHSYSKQEKFFRHMEYKPFSMLQTKKYLLNKILINDFKNNFFWSIEYKKKIVGTYFIHDFNFSRKSCSISYGINPEYWNKKIFTNITNKLVKILIKKIQLKRISALTRINNHSSIKGLKSNGFKKEGILKNYYYDNKDKKFYDGIVLALINDK